MSVKDNYPNILPSLNLNFAQVKQLDPRISYSRASTGTFYDGKTVTKAEENLLTYSQEFDNAVWNSSAVSRAANTTIAPDGTTTADSIIEDGTLTAHLVISLLTIGAGVFTMSVFAKPGVGSRFLTIGFNRTSSVYVAATFDLSLGTHTQTLVSTYTGASVTITAAAQGFYRCTVTATVDSITDARIGLASAGTYTPSSRGFESYTGDGASSIILWGAQLEQRSSVTAYTPTTTQPITNYIPVLLTAQANVARFQHNPITGESEGFWVEEQRTNLVRRSEEFNTTWVPTDASVTSNTVVSPDGTLTGDKLVEGTGTGGHLLVQDVTGLADNTTYTVSCFVKAAERSWVAITLTDKVGNNHRVWYNVSTGTQGTTNGIVSAFSATNVGNGWYRLSVSASSSTGAFAVQMRISLGSADNTASYTGNGYSGIYIWGAQLEAGTRSSSYIKTEASQVTRSADNASMVGANFTSWGNSVAGTVYVEVADQDLSDIATYWAISNNTYQQRINISGSTSPANRVGYRYITNNNAYVSNAGTVTNVTSFKKLATSFTQSSMVSYFNGLQDFNVSFAGLAPTVDRMIIGDPTGAIGGMMYVKKIAFYPQALSATQLAALSS